MSCPVPPGNEHYPIQVITEHGVKRVCAKCQQEY